MKAIAAARAAQNSSGGLQSALSKPGAANPSSLSINNNPGA